MTVGHVVIIGPMGCGKSTVGALVAASLGRDVIDNDTALELSTGMTAREIAARDGLIALHEAESATLDEMLTTAVPAVITAPASVVDTIERATLDGQMVVYLHCSEQARSSRARSGHHRPALELTAEQVTHRDERSRALADLVVDASETDAETLAAEIVAATVSTVSDCAPSTKGRPGTTRRPTDQSFP